MIDIFNRLGAPEFWLSVIIGPVVATLLADWLRRRTAVQWLRGFAFATGLALLAFAAADLRLNGYRGGYDLAYPLTGFMALFFASFGPKAMLALLVAGINFPFAALVAALIYNIGADDTFGSQGSGSFTRT